MLAKAELAACKTLAFHLFPRALDAVVATSKVTTLALAPQQWKRDVQEKRLELPRQQAVLVLVVDEHRQALPQ